MARPTIIRKGERNRPLTFKQKVCRIISFSPLILLLAERLYIPLEAGHLAGYLNVETLAVSKTAKTTTFVRGFRHDLLPLDILTRSSNTWTSYCPTRTKAITNVVLDSEPSTNHKIPMIVHQTARSRCLTDAFTKIASQWKLANHSYYFHDDEAVIRLLRRNFPEFPHLKIVSRHCIRNPTIKADLWRYLVLWVYGGIYADLDSAPAIFDASTIKFDDDAFFVVEQYHILSQWFMAVTPRHPLMFYAIQITLQNILEGEDTLKMAAHSTSGPHVLHAAYQMFRRDGDAIVDPVGRGMKPVWSGIFHGTNNRTVRVVGKGENENEYVTRMAIDAYTKKRDYKKMGMVHFKSFMGDRAKQSGQTCYDAILADIISLG